MSSICQVTSQDHVIDGTCHFYEWELLIVCHHTATLVTIGLMLTEIQTFLLRHKEPLKVSHHHAQSGNIVVEM